MNYLVLEIWNVLNNPDAVPDFLAKLESETYDKVILISANEWEYKSIMGLHWSEFIRITTQKNIQVELIAGLNKLLTPVPVLPNVNVIYWDKYWLIKTYAMVNHVPRPSEYKYHFISMNNAAHSHRCHLLDLVAKHDLVKDNAISWLNGRAYDDPYEWRYHTPVTTQLNEKNVMWDQYILPREYDESFAQLISESTMQAIELSEKTATPLMIGKPFISAAAPGVSNLMTELGFELYTEMFDYSFDMIDDQEKRFDLIVENFKRLSETPLKELSSLYDAIKPKLLHNQNRMREIAFDFDSWPEPAKEIVAVHRRTGKILDRDIINIYTTLRKKQRTKI